MENKEMKKFNVYFETSTDGGNMIVEAKDKEGARYAALELLDYDATFVEVAGEAQDK